MARRGGDAVDVVFGAKQLLLALVVAACTLGGTFLIGVEAGHRRAQRGQASPLSFLEREADDHTGQVPIPEVLVREAELERERIRAQEKAAEAAEAAADRQKPTPVVSASESGQPTPAPAAEEQPPAVQPAATSAPEAGRIQIQVAALKNRSNASGLVDWLRNQGYQAYLDESGPDGFLRVYVGPFSEDDGAAAVQRRLEQEGFKPIVRRL